VKAITPRIISGNPRPVFVEKAIGPKNHKNTKTVELQLEEST